MYPKIRTRRIRGNKRLNRLSRETTILPEDLILPIFIINGKNKKQDVRSMPGVEKISVGLLPNSLEKTDLNAVILFGVPEADKKNGNADYALDENGIVPSAIRKIREIRPDIAVITDVCLCAYTDHGHCGIVNNKGIVDNDRTLRLLSKMAVIHAAAGADMVAPSAMMDGQVAVVRQGLDDQGLTDTAIMSYSAKFASSFYGPFRDAAQSAPAFGDRSSYQLLTGNRREAIRDALLDESEGADWLMVKPGMPYLDVLYELRQNTRLPIAAYQVSGEYAMIKHASAAGAFNERKAVMESLICLKRAGADAIITYYAQEVRKWLKI